jgi:biotin carboxyl carrier protein
MKYAIGIGDRQFDVEILNLGADRARVTVDGGTPLEVRFARSGGSAAPGPGPKVPDPVQPSTAAAAGATPGGGAAPGGALLAPMPGVILEIRVQVGDPVAAGQVVAVMEAMKMENNLTAESAGKVREIRVQKGGAVATGDVLMVIG